jgi:serralysin
MPAVTTIAVSGNSYVNGVLGTYKWAPTSLTFSFPTSGAYYGGGEYSYDDEHQNGFAALNSTQQTAARSALAMYAAVSNLTFAEITETSSQHGDLRFAMSNDPSTAWAYFPSTAAAGGDSWYSARGTYNSPIKGNYAFTTFVHEIGHALGLDHAHEGVAVPADRDSMEYTVMSYRSYVGGSTSSGYTNETWGFAQSLMMYDIAAIQHMYGANFNTNSGNTVYRWSPTTGEMSVNGVGQGAPGGNRIFMTVWDGNGVDTYDFSAYAGGLRIDLQPGAWTTTSSAQVARLHYSGSATAAGNIANALLYNNDARSLIENAIGGAAADVIAGNQAANTLTGGGGDDSLYGHDGNDTLIGGAGSEYINGGAGTDVAVFSANRANYSISRDGSYWVVQDLRSGSPDGSDWLVDIESYRFADQEIAAGSMTLTGDGLANSLYGGIGNDVLYGNGGEDSLFGYEGNDTLVGGADGDFIGGGSGHDVAVFSGTLANYSIFRDRSYWVVQDMRSSGSDGSDWLLDVETFRFADQDVQAGVTILRGNDSANSLYGGAGNDVLYGNGGEDSLFGYEGNDTLTGGAAGDFIGGGAGHDVAVFSGNLANYSIYRDRSYWVVQDMRSASPDGSDWLLDVETFRFADQDVTAGVAVLRGNDSANSLYGGAGNDTLYGNGGEDSLFGYEGNDILVGGAAGDFIGGGSGHDVAVFSGTLSNYSIFRDRSYWVVQDMRSSGSDGSDWLLDVETFRFADQDVQAGAIILRGTDTANSLAGSAGNDVLYGNGGEDSLFGYEGNDVLVGGADGDFIGGGSGHDVAVFSGTLSNYSIFRDRSYWVVQDMRSSGSDGSDWLLDVETFRFADQDVQAGAIILRGTHAANSLAGSAGNDVLYGNGGEDSLFGYEGNDTLVGGADGDFIGGGSGHDVAVFSGTLANYSIFRDRSYWVVQDMRSSGSDGSDWLLDVETFRFADQDVQAGVTILRGNDSANSLYGGAGNDVLYGNGGEDSLFGYEGNDTLTGGAAGDFIGGGAGHDVAVFSGNLANYSIYRDRSYWVVQDMRSASPDGSDWLLDVETFRFADQSVAAASPGPVAPESNWTPDEFPIALEPGAVELQYLHAATNSSDWFL